MKIGVLSRAKGTIVAAVLPPEPGVKNLAEGGPAAGPGTSFDEVELPPKTRNADLPRLLRHGRVKRTKESASLDIAEMPSTKAKTTRQRSRKA